MGLLDWLKPTPPLDDETRRLIERAVVGVDPLIKSVAGYERTLAPIARSAFDYCQRVALAIPGPFTINRAAFASDPLVHALFASADDIEAMLARSQCVRQHLATMAGGGQCCALLGMRHHEKSGFGVRLTGDIVRVDEPQKTLYFSDHTLAEPGPDLDAVQRNLAQSMFDGLVQGFAAQVHEMRKERRHESVEAMQPQNLVTSLASHMSAPEASLRLTPLKMSVNRAGVIVEDRNDAIQADTLRFVELTTRDRRQWVVMTVRIDRNEARDAAARLVEASRNIVI